MHSERLEGIELVRSVGLLEDLVDVELEIRIELLEKILEEKGEKLTSPE